MSVVASMLADALPTLANTLSPRERECLLWAARGKTYSEISLITGLAFGTVKSHLDGARHKLNCAILPAATAMAVALGLITLDDLIGRDGPRSSLQRPQDDQCERKDVHQDRKH